jgi:hypothetical protein
MVADFVFPSPATTAEWLDPDLAPLVSDGVHPLKSRAVFMGRNACLVTRQQNAAVSLQSPRCLALPRSSVFSPVAARIPTRSSCLGGMRSCRQSPRYCDLGTAKEPTRDRLGSIQVSLQSNHASQGPRMLSACKVPAGKVAILTSPTNKSLAQDAPCSLGHAGLLRRA